MIPVILSGGSGTRLWPYSRSLFPKQFLPLVGEDTLLQHTLLRLKNSIADAPAILVCNQQHRFMAAEQLRTINHQALAILLEPFARNTAPAIALAALQVLSTGQDDVMLVLPADHIIQNLNTLHQAIEQANQAAEQGHLVTFGIVPSHAETGYGYIRADGEGQVKPVAEFVEKPDLATAEQYLASGQYYWNSGMFAFKASVLVEQLKIYAPDMLSACEKALANKTQDLDFIRIDENEFAHSPSDSIDYALMEKTDRAVVIPLDADWSDVGSWSALWDVSEKDANGNASKGDVLIEQSHNNYIQSEHKLIAVLGVDNLVVVETDDAILVADKERVQEVKTLVQRLDQHQRDETKQHRKVYRPWGYYDCIDNGERFQVKRIVVNPGQRLSLQMHHHRAEHWVVVSGTAVVTRNDEEILLSENQSTFIPLGVKHRLENPGSIPLEIIEVQSGSYLGEDDIVRFEDTYGRD